LRPEIPCPICDPDRDGKDLIYEGIATLKVSSDPHKSSFDGKDLIYEGIATLIQNQMDMMFFKKGTEKT